VREPAQVLKDTVGLQQMCGLDPFETENHRIDDRQQQFAHAVAIVSLPQADLGRDCFLQTYSSEKTVQQVDASVVRELPARECDFEFSWSFWHPDEPYFLSSFHREATKSSAA